MFFFRPGFTIGALCWCFFAVYAGACKVRETASLSAGPPGVATQDSDGVLRIRLSRELPTLNPLDEQVFDVWRIAFPWVLEPLVKIERSTGRLTGVLAESWSAMEKDGRKMTYRFRLRPDVYWHDGRRLSPEDVRFTMGLVTNGAAVPADIEKAAGRMLVDLQTGRLPVADVVVLGRDALEIRLNIPYGPFLERLAQVPILPAHLFEECGFEEQCDASDEKVDDLKPRFCSLVLDSPACRAEGKTMVGTGPFRLLQWWPGEKLIFLRNDTYWGESPQSRRVEFHFLTGKEIVWEKMKNGSLDVVADLDGKELEYFRKRISADRKGGGMFSVKGVRPHGVSFMIMRGTRDRFLRRALWMLIDRRDLLERVPFGGESPSALLNHPVSHDSFQQSIFGGVHYSGKSEDALNLLEKSGWKRGKKGILKRDGAPLRLKMVLPEEAVLFKEIFEKTASQLKKHGFLVDVETIPNVSFISGLTGKRVPGRYSSAAQALSWANVSGEKAVTALQIGHLSPWTDLYDGFHSSRRSHITGFGTVEDSVLDGLLEKWALEPDREKRVGLTSEILERIWQMAVVLPLHPPVYPLLVSPRVSGIRDGGTWMDLRSLQKLAGES